MGLLKIKGVKECYWTHREWYRSSVTESHCAANASPIVFLELSMYETKMMKEGEVHISQISFTPQMENLIEDNDNVKAHSCPN